jgi:hypothetical protein
MMFQTVHRNLNKPSGLTSVRSGFSLAEVLAAMTIGAMVVVAVLAIYNRAEHSANAVLLRIDESQLPREVLQYIAEDLDSMISSGSDAKVTIQNKVEATAGGKLIPAARLTFTRTITDSAGKEHIFEEVIWQSSYNIESYSDGLVLYRSRSGINLEDKVLQENKYDWERELFVPICSGVTYFNISVPTGDSLVDRWDGTPPTGIVVTLSFAEPFKNVDGSYDVPEEEKFTRTIAIDRTRKIQFDIPGAQSGGKGQDKSKEADVSESNEKESSKTTDAKRKRE